MKIIRNAVRHRESSRLKITLRMKLLLSLFFATLLQINAGLEGTHSQKITLDLKSATVLDVIHEIETTTDYRFLYRKDQLDTSQKMDIRAKNEKLERVLQKVFGDSGMTYKIEQKQIVLTPNDDIPSGSLGNTTNPVQEQHAVTGTVSDAQGPMPGVSIYLKDSDRGTFSGADGAYQIMASPNDILVFSYIGYRTVERSVGNLTNINVELQEDVTELNEVVLNAGYYTTTEKERTGNISQIKAREIEQQPVSNPLAAMQGRMAGVDIRQSTGVPGGGFQIQIRGRNSLRANADYPLYIIDGVPFTSEPLLSISGIFPPGNGLDPLNTINPNDIESIEVLKDADATSIYGSRGANGVILITTKKGTSGKTSVDINFQTGMSKVSHKMNLLNTPQYLEMRREAFENDGIEPTIGNAPDLLLWDQKRNTDWQNELIGGTAYVTNAQSTISGGTRNTSFILGGAYRKETTVFSGDFGNTRITGHSQLNHRSDNEKFKLSLSLNYGNDSYDLFNTSRFTRTALWLPPNAPELYDNEGNLNWELAPDGSPTFENPAAGFFNKQHTVTKNFISNIVLDYKILPDWTLKANLGYTDLNQEEIMIQPKKGFSPIYQDLIQSYTFLYNQNRSSWIAEPQILYNKKFKTSQLDILVGMTWQKSLNTRRGINGSGYTSDKLLGSLSGASEVALMEDTENDYRYQAVFGRISYNYKGKYILNLTGRRDGSSRFGADKHYGSFGAIGGAWVFSEEKWVREQLGFISFGKLRGSYGTTGSDQIGDYGYLDTYRTFTGNYRGVGGLYPTRLANPEYGWEVNKKLETGLELGLFRERIHFALSWFRNRSSNQLVGYRLPATTGFTSIQANMPATVQNTGWELEFMSRNVKSEVLNWNTSFNLTIPSNKLLKYPNIEESSYSNSYIVGEPLNLTRRYVYTGINPESGFYEVLDQNGDNIINSDDRIYIDNFGRRYYGGVQNNFQYKNWQLDFLFEFVKQKGNGILSSFSSAPGYMINQPVEVLDRWQEPGDENKYQRFTQSSSNRSFYSNANISDMNLQDASFIRFKNVSLAYTFPKEFLQSSIFNNLRVFVLGQNLFTWTKYIGMDPQSPGSTYLPSLRTITMGVQLQF